MVVNFMLGVANEVRAILANLGHRSLNDIIGRPELLQPVDLADYPKADTLDLSEILTPADPTGTQPRYHQQERNDRDGVSLDDQILVDAKDAIAQKTSIQLSYPIQNTHRTVGAKLSGEIADAMVMLACLTERFSATLRAAQGKVSVLSVSAVCNLC